MASVAHPRGPLPRRVYWVRRGVVLGVALLLVVGLAQIFGGTGADEPGSKIEASTSSAKQEAAEPTVSLGPVAPSKKLRLKAKVPLLPPSGECLDDEISVLPTVPRAWGGGPIVIKLMLQGTQPACTFDVSPESVVVKITSGRDRIWSSQDCPEAVPTTQVIVRSGLPAEVPVTWSGRRSDEQCSGGNDWAEFGFYHVHAAALGSTPTDVQFEVTRAPTRVVTRTPKPRPSGSSSTDEGRRPSSTKASEPEPSPSGKPSKRP